MGTYGLLQKLCFKKSSQMHKLYGGTIPTKFQEEQFQQNSKRDNPNKVPRGTIPTKFQSVPEKI